MRKSAPETSQLFQQERSCIDFGSPVLKIMKENPEGLSGELFVFSIVTVLKYCHKEMGAGGRD